MVWKSKEAKLKNSRRYRELHRERIRQESREYARQRRNQDPNYGKAAGIRWRTKNRDAINAKQREDRTGCTPEQYDKALIEQQNKCLICLEEFEGNCGQLMACADHNHETGQFRGLLHQICNRGLGHFKDSIFRLTNAIEYLKLNE